MSGTGAGVDTADRGALTIAPVVLRKIVEHVADEVPGTLRHSRRLAGIDVGETGASARVAVGSTRSGTPPVDVTLELTLQYPSSVQRVVGQVRTRVGEELERLAGHRVRSLRVTVGALRGAPAAEPNRPI